MFSADGPRPIGLTYLFPHTSRFIVHFLTFPPPSAYPFLAYLFLVCLQEICSLFCLYSMLRFSMLTACPSPFLDVLLFCTEDPVFFP